MKHTLVLICGLFAGFTALQVNAAECDLSDMSNVQDDCSLTPSGYKVLVYALGLCETAPRLPTPTSAVDYSNCEIVFDKIESNGVPAELAGVGYSTALNTDFSLPPPGKYRYIVVGIGQEIGVSRTIEFPASITAMDGSTGRFCATAFSEVNTNWSTCDATEFPTPGYSIGKVEQFEVGGQVTFAASFPRNIDAYAMTDEFQLSSNAAETSWILGVQTLSSPLVVTTQTSSIDIGFVVTDGMGIYDDNGGVGGYVLNIYPNEFSFLISAD